MDSPLTYTDANDNFVFENLRPGEHWLVAFGKDFKNQLRKDILVEARKFAELTIVSPKEPPKQVRGKILDEDGNPLTNVNVTIRGQSSPTISGSYIVPCSTPKNYGNGEIVFTVDEAGRYDLTISVDGFEPAKVKNVIVGGEKSHLSLLSS